MWVIQYNTIVSNARDNHSLACDYPRAVTEYIQTELNEGALLGPFQCPPHHAYTWSALMT